MDGTGVDPDRHLGTLEQLYQLWEEASEPPTLAATAPTRVAEAPDKPAIMASPTPEPERELAAVVPLPARTVPPPPAPPTALPQSPRTAPWPPAEDLPPAPPPAPSEPDLIAELTHQPVEQEATLALLVTLPWGQVTADRMRRWFGPRGLELNARIEDGHAAAAFELGVLLVNRDAVQEGMLLLEQASRLDAELLLTLPVMHIGDRLNGSIVRDISRRVAAGYGKAGYRVREQMWINYTRKIDASDPLAVLQYRDAHGRHASGCYVFHPAELEVQRIKRAYWRARALDDLDDAELPTMPLPTLTAAQVAQLVSTATKDDPIITVSPARVEPPTAGLGG